MGLIEAFQRIGISREQRLHFEQARRVMREVGGKELLKGKAIELKAKAS